MGSSIYLQGKCATFLFKRVDGVDTFTRWRAYRITADVSVCCGVTRVLSWMSTVSLSDRFAECFCFMFCVSEKTRKKGL